MNEIWKDILGYEKCYQVSNSGQVRSLDRFVNAPFGSKAFKKGKINAEFNTPINIQIDFSEKSNIKIEHPFIFKIDEAVRKVKDFSFRNDIRYLYLNSIIMKTNNIIDFDLLSTDIETEVYLENPLKFKLIDKNKFNKFQEKFVMVK